MDFHKENNHPGKEILVHQPGALPITVLLGFVVTNLLRDIELLQRVRRWATKNILNDFRSDYKSQLLALNLLPLMYILELHDVMFAVACLKSSHKKFDILNFIIFSSQTTRSSSQFKLVHQQAYSTRSRHFYFNCLPRLWNSLPPIDLELCYKYITCKCHLRNHLWDHFTRNFDSHRSCTFHYVCPCVSCSQLFHSPTFN